MRVTHVITRLIIGGAQENTLATVLGLRQIAGLDVPFISGLTVGPEGSLEPQAGPLLVVPELIRQIHPLKDVLVLNKLENIFREQKPDIVHTHSGKAGILGRMAARRAGVPVIFHWRLHKSAALKIQHGHCTLKFWAFYFKNPTAATGDFRWIIHRAQKTLFVCEQGHDFFLVPQMVAAGHGIHPGGKDFLGGPGRDARPAGGIFAIGNDEIHGVPLT